MGQVTIYLDDDLEAKMRKAAKSLNVSQSKWIAALIKAKIDNEWTNAVKELAGAWQDLPTISEIRNQNGDDAPREAF